MSAKRRPIPQLSPPRHNSESKPSPGMVEALRALSAPRVKPSEADAPRPRPFHGSPPPQIDGQLSIDA